jgi:hypothetical protein
MKLFNFKKQVPGKLELKRYPPDCILFTKRYQVNHSTMTPTGGINKEGKAIILIYPN